MHTIDYDRLANLPPLRAGAHEPGSGAMCAMEAASWVAHEPQSDHPQCVCPVIGAFLRAWNDALPDDEERTRLLKPLIPRVIGTRGDASLERRRAAMAADWLIRQHAPAWLRLARLDTAADALASLSEIVDLEQLRTIAPTLSDARNEVRAAISAARAVARTAAWGAAANAGRAAAGSSAWEAAVSAAWVVPWWDTARTPVVSAAWDDAVSAAWDDAVSAAWDAAVSAAWEDAVSAAREAARAATATEAENRLRPTQEELQRSALELVERMITATLD